MTHLDRPSSRLCIAIAAALLSASHATTVFAADLRTADHPVREQYIVVLKDHAARLSGETRRAAPVAAAAKAIASTHGARLVRSYDHVLRGFVVQADDEALARLLADPRVDHVQEDGRIQALATQFNPPWGLDRIDQNALPLSGSYTYENTTRRPRIYVIDSGIRTDHSEFAGRIGNGVSFIYDGQGTNDCNGHGTHVAGTAAGTTWGVAKNAIVHPVRILGCSGIATFSNTIAGMDWVAANRILPAVANLSFNATQIMPTLDTAANNLIASGVTLVIAAGNQNSDSCGFSPGRVPTAITVGATNQSDAKWSQSAYGPCVDVFAPGVAIKSAFYRSSTDTYILDGTSMAAPHVAGAIARYLNIYPDTTPAQMSSILTGAATPNVVIGAGAGSPNRLLYIPELAGTAPTIGGFLCPDYGNSGGGTYFCSLTYSSTTPAALAWPDGSSGNTYSASCSAGTVHTVNASVSNAYGTDSRTTSFGCPTGPIP